MSTPMDVTIIGTGYVGLVSAACYAEQGHRVTCVDVDQSKVDAVNAGRAFLHEPGLQELLDRNVPDRLSATTDLPWAVARSDLVMVAVPTPFDARSGRIDLSYVLTAARDVGAALNDTRRTAVILKSTCVPGTTIGQFYRAVAKNAANRLRRRELPRVPQRRDRCRRLHVAGSAGPGCRR